MKLIHRVLPPLCLMLCGVFALSPAIARQPKTIVLKNAVVWTGDERKPFAEAVAVRNNRILAVGSEADVVKAAGTSVETTDLGGRFLMPGINDAHIHFLSGGMHLLQVDLIGARSLDEMQARIRKYAAENPNEPWIVGSGWEYAAFPGSRNPTKADLDAAVSDRPAFLYSYDGHTAWMNSKAIEISGITGEEKLVGIGEVVLDPVTKRPAGMLKETAKLLVQAKIPPPTRERKLEAIRRMLTLANSLGITSFQNASGSRAEVELYEELLKAGDLPMRVRIAIGVNPYTTQADVNAIRELAKKFRGPNLTVNAVKLIMDGVIETHTAAMLEPYSDDPSTAGKPAYTQEQANRVVAMCDKAGLQVFIHAIGDKAVRMSLDAFAYARKVNGVHDSRFRIEHIETLQASDIPRFKALGAIASMEPIHADPGTIDVWSRAIGPDRTSRGFAWQSLEKAGARVTFSSDWPAAITVSPIRGLHNAVNRRTIEGTPEGGWIPTERVSLETALRAYTVAGAYAEFQEKSKGRIAPGMLADLTVLDRNPFKLEPTQLHTCKVVATMLDGKFIFRAEEPTR